MKYTYIRNPKHKREEADDARTLRPDSNDNKKEDVESSSKSEDQKSDGS